MAQEEKSTLWAVVEGIRNLDWHKRFNIDKTSSCEQYLH